MAHSYRSCLLAVLSLTLLAGLVGCNSDDGGVAPGPILNLSTASLAFTGVAGGANPPSQRVTVTNGGTGDMTFTATKTAAWISLVPNTSNTIYVEVYTTDLDAGEYNDTIIVSSPQASNSPRRVAVKLTIAHGLAVNPGSFRFTALRNGDNPPVKKLAIINNGGGGIDYTITGTGSWITLSKVAGVATDTVEVGAASSTLASGVYSGRLTVASPQTANQVIVTCSLMVSSWDRQELGLYFDLRDVDFVDAAHGWLTGFIGNNPGHVGVIMATSDSSRTWQQVHLENNTNMGGISMIDENKGWAVGDSAVLLKTINGVDWTRVTDLPVADSINLWHVLFVSANRGWIIGTNGTILHTNDGGTSWLPQNSSVDVSLAGVYFVDENEGWIVGNNGRILHTTLAGHDWTLQASGTISDLWGIYFADSQNGWVVGRDGILLHTTNGGQNWLSSFPGPTVQFQQITFADDALHGWIVGQTGTIMYTADGGATWNQQLTGVTNWLFDVHFFDTNRGLVVGQEGLVLKTLGGGF